MVGIWLLTIGYNDGYGRLQWVMAEVTTGYSGWLPQVKVCYNRLQWVAIGYTAGLSRLPLVT